MKKRIVTIALVIALLATCFGGTLAYLTDKDAKTNVFTVGNVDVVLYESTLHRQNDKATDEQIIADAANYQTYLATAGQNMVPGRDVMKAPYVKNTGKNAAYVRITVKQSEAMWNTTEMMEYTTAQNAGAIVATYDVANYTCVYTYTEALEPGEMTYYAPFWKFKILESLDNGTLACWNEQENIEVIVEAIQAEGFDSAAEAFAAFDAQN